MQPFRNTRFRWFGAVAAGMILMAGACDNTPPDAPETSDGASSSASTNPAAQEFPDVIDVVAQRRGEGVYQFDVTISSPYDTPQRYADGFRILDSDGRTLAVRELLHDHAAEQPFTRSLTDVEIPPGTKQVTVEGRDLTNGWGGGTFKVTLEP